VKSLLLAALLVAVLVVLLLKPWSRLGGDAPGPGGAAASPEFMRACVPVASARGRPEDFCRCLWTRGVRRVAAIVIEPAARAAAEECAKQK
jgi:hypothetical protein